VIADDKTLVGVIHNTYVKRFEMATMPTASVQVRWRGNKRPGSSGIERMNIGLPRLRLLCSLESVSIRRPNLFSAAGWPTGLAPNVSRSGLSGDAISPNAHGNHGAARAWRHAVSPAEQTSRSSVVYVSDLHHPACLHAVTICSTHEPKDGYPLTKASNRRVPTNLVRARMSLMGCRDVWAAFWVCFAQTHARPPTFLLE